MRKRQPFLARVYEIEAAEAAPVPCALSEARVLPSRTLLYNLRSTPQFAIFESFNVACSRTNNIVYIIENTLFTLLKRIFDFRASRQRP